MCDKNMVDSGQEKSVESKKSDTGQNVANQALAEFKPRSNSGSSQEPDHMSFGDTGHLFADPSLPKALENLGNDFSQFAKLLNSANGHASDGNMPSPQDAHNSDKLTTIHAGSDIVTIEGPAKTTVKVNGDVTTITIDSRGGTPGLDGGPIPAGTDSQPLTPPTAAIGAATGKFSVINGQIIGPDGQSFTAKGVNDGVQQAVNDQGAMLQALPGLNMVRLNANLANGDTPAQVQQVIDAYTAKGIVVEVEDHTSSGNEGNDNSNVVSGQDLIKEENWYSQIAAANVNNPYVWFGTANEPNNPANQQGVVDQEVGIYNAIRNTGNNNMVEMELQQGVYAAPLQANPAAFANMTNIAFDAHFYGWEANNSTDQNTVNQALNSMVQQAQTVKSAQGTVPVVIGEYGNSGTGYSIDPNGQQVVDAVTGSGLGSDAWQWYQYGNGSGANADNNSVSDGNGNLTAYGEQIAKYINENKTTA